MHGKIIVASEIVIPKYGLQVNFNSPTIKQRLLTFPLHLYNRPEMKYINDKMKEERSGGGGN